MGLKVEIISCDDLSLEEKKENYVGENDWSWFLKVTHVGQFKDEVISMERDGWEPEDAVFVRDLKWIKPLLEEVYELGLKDGKNE